MSEENKVHYKKAEKGTADSEVKLVNNVDKTGVRDPSGTVAHARAISRERGRPATPVSDTYCIGYIFDYQMTNILLLQKVRPLEHFNRFNGPGGKVEPGEKPVAAMRRELREETGLDLEEDGFFPFGIIKGEDLKNPGLVSEIYLFAAVTDLSRAKTMTDEDVFVTELTRVGDADDCVSHLPWLARAAADHIRDGQPKWIEVEQPIIGRRS